ncbi:hypothetical protein [Flammeovirga sp. SubArs3]|uniref:GumC family protein n=1 Tax=Flammeovirga sp. SubArs3 TaxID=2995316 RepID=UPI00248CD315|nr:hypothetical protein [Flammeovirga sp. SubArs3]
MQNLIYILKSIVKKIYLWLGIPIVLCVVLYTQLSDFKTYQSKAKLQFELNTDGSLSVTSKSLQLFEIGLMFTDLLEIARIKRVIQHVQLMILIESLQTDNLYDIKIKTDLYSEKEIIKRAQFLLDNFIEFDLQRPVDVIINNILVFNGLSVEDLNKRIKINRIGSSKYIEVSVEDKSPYNAKFIVDALTDAWIREYRFELQSRYHEKSESINKSCINAKQDLVELMDSLKRYKRRNNVIDIKATKKFIIERSAEIKKEISLVKKDMRSVENTIDYLERTLQNKSDFGFQGNSQELNTEIMMLKDSLRKLQRDKEYNAYNLEKLPSDYPYKINEKINLLETKINKKLSNSVTNTTYDPSLAKQAMVSDYLKKQIEYVKLDAQLKSLQTEMGKLNSTSRKFIDIISDITKLEHQIETDNQHYLILLEKKYFAELLERDAGHNFFIIEKASFPIKAISSKKGLIIVGAFVGATILLLVTVALLIIFDPNHHLPAQIEKHAKIPIITSLYIIPIREFTSRFTPKFYKYIQTKRDNIKRRNVADQNADSKKYIRRLIVDLPKSNKNIISFMGARTNSITFDTAIEIQQMLAKSSLKSIIIYNDWFSPLSEKEVKVPIVSIDTFEASRENCILNLSEQSCSPYDFKLPQEWFYTLSHLRTVFDYVIIIPPPTHKATIWMEWLNLSSDIFYVYELHRRFERDDIKNQTYMLEQHANVIGGILTSTTL